MFIQPMTLEPKLQIKNNLGQAFKPKRAGTKTSHVVFVLDYSSSMQSCKEATILGYNEFLRSQRQNEVETGIKTYVSLYKFDGYNVNCAYSRIPVKKAALLDRYSYNPNGMTNLYDGIGGALMQVNNMLAETAKKNRDSVIITILTDGQENTSKVFVADDIKLMVSKAEKKDWTFMFLGANIDAFAVGGNLGFGSHNTMEYSTQKMQDTMAYASSYTNNIKASRSMGLSAAETYAANEITEEARKKVK